MQFRAHPWKFLGNSNPATNVVISSLFSYWGVFRNIMTHRIQLWVRRLKVPIDLQVVLELSEGPWRFMGN